MPSYSGCVYRNPPKRFAPQEVEDLSDYALSNMKLVGLPIKESHSSRDIGIITDEWSDSDGGKHITFDIRNPTAVVQTALDTQILSHLSLSHEVGSPPKPIEVSVCSKGRRPGTTISPLSPTEYKGATMAKEQTNVTSPAIIMASNSPVTEQAQPAAPIPAGIVPDAQAVPPAVNSTTPADSVPSAEDGAGLAASNPDKYMEVFRSIVDNLDGDAKEIFIQGQLRAMKEKEEYQQQLDLAKKENETMAKTHKENLNQTMSTIRNFFLQGADQQDGITENDLGKMEGLLQSNPEMQNSFNRLVQCAARRVETSESNLKVHQKAVEQTSQEKELFARMRGIARDSAEPTYSFHGFEQTGSKRPLVSENANAAVSVAPPAKKARTNSHLDEQLKMIAAGMSSTLPPIPSNINAKEQFPIR